MDLQKYINHLFKSIKNRLSEWLSLEEGETILAADVYRFLHSIREKNEYKNQLSFKMHNNTKNDIL